MKIDLKNLQGKINTKDLIQKTGSFLNRKEVYVLFVIFFIFLGYCGYLWYAYSYSYQWDGAKKQEYINTKNAGTSFNKERFEKVLGNITARQDEYQKNIDNPKDIFRLK